ncbi:MAG TPA: flagellar motor switch protein FliG, partial [Bacillales bacterium]|nr:flagellar motor switch protein FliG [Bacillales bacterium]
MAKDVKELSGREKAAILLISMGPDSSASIYKHLTEEEIEALTLEISSASKIDSRLKNKVIDEFHQLALAQDYISEGGIAYAKTILEKALGKHEAMNMINRLTSALQVRPFDFARKADPAQVLNFIQNEHPQTIALVLSYLDSAQAGQILSALPHDMQADIAKRIALMDSTFPEALNEVEHTLEKKLSTAVPQDYTQTGGVQAVVEVL